MTTEYKSHKDRAIVIGGSMAGLLAARVLSDHYSEVVIIERDKLPEAAEQRKGVPQGYHAHALLAGGQAVVQTLFPSIVEEILDAGAVPADPLKDGAWFFEGAPLYRAASGSTGILASRPLLEGKVRERVKRLNAVSFLECRSVRELASSTGNDRVTGVVLDDETLSADLVIDATGRGSRAPAWLRSLGYECPKEENVEVDLVYTTRIVKPRDGRLGDTKFIVLAPTPQGKRGGVIGIQENGHWICTLFGHFGNVAPTDLEGFIEYAKTLPSPAIYDAIRDAQPIGDASTFRFPASRRRRYEKLARFPGGFLVFGDAICSFNPIYAQGMSVAALQAEALRQALASGTNQLASRFFRMAAKAIDNPWNIAVGGDLRMPETLGPRSKVVDGLNWYIANVHKQAHGDARVALAFNRVSQLLDSPAALMHPAIVTRVLFGALRRTVGKKVPASIATADPLPHMSREGF